MRKDHGEEKLMQRIESGNGAQCTRIGCGTDKNEGQKRQVR